MNPYESFKEETNNHNDDSLVTFFLLSFLLGCCVGTVGTIFFLFYEK